MIELIQETRKEMADWEKKFAKSRGRITGAQKAKIDKLPLSQKKKVLALARKYATLGNKGSKVDPAHVAYNREMIKYKSETEREKRHSRKARKAHEKEVEDQINMARGALGVMKARDEIKKKRESSKALVPVSREEPVMLKSKEDTNAVVKSQPKPGGRKKSSVGMSKADIDWSLKAKLDDIARELIKTTNPIKRVLLKAKAKRLKKSYAAAKSLKEDHCKKPDSLDCRVEKIAKKYAKKEADKHEEELHEKAPPGDKYERMVKHIKASGASKEVAYATAWKNYNKKNKIDEGKLSDWSIDFEEKHGRKPTNDDLKADYKKKQKQEKRKAATKRLSAFVRVSGIKNGK